MEKERRGKLSLKKAWAKIAQSVALISLPLWLVFFGYQLWQMGRQRSARYTITNVIQTGPEREALRTVYLAEIMGLAQDHPTNLYRFSIQEAQRKLLSCPVIAQANVAKIPPNTIYVDYTVRHPVALLYDYSNTALDKEGVTFPLNPFFAPKRLPEIYLGMEDALSWGKPLQGRKVALALQQLQALYAPSYEELFRVLRIDVSKAFAPCIGQQQIVLIVEDTLRRQEPWGLTTYHFPRLLRLSTDNWQQNLRDYLALREELIVGKMEHSRNASHQTTVHFGATIVDLRLPGVAYLRF
jgi:hypothetical protein